MGDRRRLGDGERLRVVRRWGVPLVSYACLMATLLIGARSAAADRPNILLAIADDQSFPHTSAYGDSVVRTPAFDRVAAKGVLFTQAFAPSPGCSPCRAALLTGRYPWQLQEAGTHASSFPSRYATYPDVLEGEGYLVGYTGKGWGPGNWRASGRERNPAGPEFNERRLTAPAGISRTDYAANFREFLNQRSAGQPFCFWYGGHEPHRGYGAGLGRQAGKDPATVEVPAFLPSVAEMRDDILDYYQEIEWFDAHLGRMLDMLEEAGELDRTLVIVTSDNGMPFPRAKANCYEYGIHMPLAISWPKEVPGGRRVEDLVSLVDLAPTILDAAEVEHRGTMPGGEAMVGRSLRELLKSDQSVAIEPEREQVFSARERHSSSRYENWGYPQRAMRTRDYLLIRNFHPERWPAGDPQKHETDGSLGPEHGGYHDIDASPTLDLLVAGREDKSLGRYFQRAVGKRPGLELYDVRKDPGCLTNLADDANYGETIERLWGELEEFLRMTGDPRMGPDGEVFEAYRRYSAIRSFPAPSE